MKTIIRESGEGERRWFFGGGVITWKVFAEEMNGAVSIFEDTMERAKTTPLHAHPEHDEIVIVLEGEILAYADGAPRKVGPGGIIVNARGTAHAIAVASESARVLSIMTPGAKAESFYRVASAEGSDGVVDFGRVAAAAKETGATTIIGPPPFAKP